MEVLMKPDEVKLFYVRDQLRMTVEDRVSYVKVKPVWSAPLSRPQSFLVLLDGKGEEITLIPDVDALPAESLDAVRKELRQRYLTATITGIKNAKQEYGATYWYVATDRGDREFVTQSLQENAQWISESHLLLIDVDGNRFEITDITALDKQSRELIAEIL
jgi:uncharacterized protein DUF1854